MGCSGEWMRAHMKVILVRAWMLSSFNRIYQDMNISTVGAWMLQGTDALEHERYHIMVWACALVMALTNDERAVYHLVSFAPGIYVLCRSHSAGFG